MARIWVLQPSMLSATVVQLPLARWEMDNQWVTLVMELPIFCQSLTRSIQVRGRKMFYIGTFSKTHSSYISLKFHPHQIHRGQNGTNQNISSSRPPPQPTHNIYIVPLQHNESRNYLSTSIHFWKYFTLICFQC